MFFRTFFVSLAAGILAGAALAQQGPVTARKRLMIESENHALTVVQMMRGELQFEPPLVAAAFAQWGEMAQQLPGLFPDFSKSGGASPKIWVNRKDFDAKAAQLGKAVAANRPRAMASLDGLSAAVPAIAAACDACHEDYRLPD
jgi:cytochrome c556